MKPTIIAAIIAVGLIGGAVALTAGRSGGPAPTTEPVQNVTMENGVQVVTITAKGGYSPRLTKAKAGIPTELHIDTSNTYDCSAAITIPSLNVREFLVPTGEKVVQVPPQEAGTTLRGLCAMGMYNFAVTFE